MVDARERILQQKWCGFEQKFTVDVSVLCGYADNNGGVTSRPTAAEVYPALMVTCPIWERVACTKIFELVL
jgi:hypothetical protein